ncbi:hypothetical protein Tco_0942744 [Tanacetum coccineum]
MVNNEEDDRLVLGLNYIDGFMVLLHNAPNMFRFEYIMAENFEVTQDVRCLATLVRSFKLIEIYIEHGVTTLDCYIRLPRFRETIEDISDEPSSIAANRTEKMLLLTWHESSEPTKEPICHSVTPSSLPQHDSSTPSKVSVCNSITPRCMPDYLLTPPTDESVITYTQLSATASQVIDDVMRQISFEEIKLDGDAGFADVAGSGVESSRLSHDESFGVDDLDLNLNEPEFTMKDVVLEDYVSSGEDVEHCNGQEDESAPSDGQFFYDDEGIDTAYETEYDVQSCEDVGTHEDDDDEKEVFLVDEENEIVEPDVDVYLFGISMDVPFDNIGITNLVPDDVLEGEDVDVINPDSFDNNPGNDDKTNNYRRRRLAELSSEMEGFINANGQWKEIKHCTYKFLSEKIFDQVRVNPDILVKAFQNQLQRKLEGVSENIRLFRSIKLGFRARGRDLLGLDGAFMKQLFPSQCLGDDIDLHPNSNFTFISDRQKDLLWRAASATSVKEFEKCMLELKTMNPKAHESLNKIPPEHWAISHFSGKVKSDLLLNNIYEVFNGKIVGGRDKPVIIFLEYIREYCMKRIMNVQSVIEKCIGPLTPTATRIIESIKKEAYLMKVQWN